MSGLSEAERAEIKTLLENMLQDLIGKIDHLSQSSQPDSLDEPIGRLSRIDAIQGQHMAMAGLGREQ